MKNNVEKMILKISNSWIIGCGLFAYGLMSYAYLDGLSNFAIIKQKYLIQLKMEEKLEVKEEKEKVIYYWIHFNIMYIIGIMGVTLVAYCCKIKD
jgi:hypothetical protein